jgi:hypothetical protein
MGETRNAYTIVIGKPHKKKNTIDIYFKAIGYQDMYYLRSDTYLYWHSCGPVSSVQVRCARMNRKRQNSLKNYNIFRSISIERFEAFKAVAMKNAVFWDVTPCGSCKSRRFGGTYRLHHEGDNDRRAKNNVSNN